MKKLLVFLCAMLLIFGVAGIATATPMSYEFQMGDESRIDTTGTYQALVMWALPYGSVVDYVFTLNEGESETFPFARIGTQEIWIDDDDLVPGEITAWVDFTNPDILEEFQGESVGFQCDFHFFQGWNLIWEDAHTIEFGDGGLFTLDLSDASFISGNFFGPDGEYGDAYADVYATVTLNSAPNPLPEPATMLLFGTGLIGLTVLGRKKFFKRG